MRTVQAFQRGGMIAEKLQRMCQRKMHDRAVIVPGVGARECGAHRLDIGPIEGHGLGQCQTPPGQAAGRIFGKDAPVFADRFLAATFRVQHRSQHGARALIARSDFQGLAQHRQCMLVPAIGIERATEVEPVLGAVGTLFARGTKCLERVVAVAERLVASAHVAEGQGILRAQAYRRHQRFQRPFGTPAHVLDDAAQAQDFRMIGRAKGQAVPVAFGHLRLRFAQCAFDCGGLRGEGGGEPQVALLSRQHPGMVADRAASPPFIDVRDTAAARGCEA